MVKNEELLQFQYHHLLSEFEILSAIAYCRKLLGRQDCDSIMEFNDLSQFFFNGDDEVAIKTLHNIDKIYRDEYFKRRQN